MKRIAKAKSILDLIDQEMNEVINIGNIDISTGIKTVDSAIGGFRFGELILIGARPAMGKTKYLFRSILKISRSVPVLLCSLDNNQRRVANKIISLKRDGGITFFIDHLSRSFQDVDVEQEKLFVSDTIFDSMEEYLLLMIDHIVNDNVKVIAIDSLQYLPQSESSLSLLEVLKEICTTFNVTIIVTSEVSPDCELRGGEKKPIMEDLDVKPSQRYLLDVVLLLYRPEYYGFTLDEDGESTAGRLEVIIAKDRESQPIDFRVECLFVQTDQD